MSDSTQPISAADVERTINDHAAAFEQERARRARLVDQKAARSQRRITRALLFGFVFMVGAFLFLAWRTETNANRLQEQAHVTDQRFYDACLVRQERQIQANVARETLVQLSADRKDPPLATVERAEYVAQLRSALLVLVEDCGNPPPAQHD